MNTTELKQKIVDELKQGHHVTTDQLLALLNTDAEIRALHLSKSRLQSMIRELLQAASIERTIDPGTYYKRYRVPSPRYRSRSYENGYEIIKRVTDHGDELVIGKGMTEPEARACVDALNGLEK